jgi:Putative peptidoglycan binding domain
MGAAHLATSLVLARTTINGRWPNRDRTSDGWIGDTAHQGRTSDHNPNDRGVVDAIDVDMFGGPGPVHRPSIVAAAMIHPAINYVIFDRRIYQAADRFRPRVYNGINPHDKHCHYSIFQAIWAETITTPWALLGAFPNWPTLQRGRIIGIAVRELQAYVNAWGGNLVVDGDFGPATETAVKNFQRSRGIAADGIVGPATRGRLFG